MLLSPQYPHQCSIRIRGLFPEHFISLEPDGSTFLRARTLSISIALRSHSVLSRPRVHFLVSHIVRLCEMSYSHQVRSYMIPRVDSSLVVRVRMSESMTSVVLYSLFFPQYLSKEIYSLLIMLRLSLFHDSRSIVDHEYGVYIFSRQDEMIEPILSDSSSISLMRVSTLSRSLTLMEE
jgi:hypothetical protein